MDNSEIRQEMTQIQAELRSALEDIKTDMWNKLQEKDRQQLVHDFDELDEMLERLKDGYIWLALVGKTSVGKSSIVNAIMQDDIAKVDELQDTTTPHNNCEMLDPNIYEKHPWKIVDLPGIMGKKAFEKYALDEAKKAHGHVFVTAGEPYQDEIEMFDNVHEALPETPKIVFVNKWDEMQHKPSRDRDAVKDRIEQKMRKYVSSVDNIIYGSANLYDLEKDDWVRQELPKLLERMYEDAGTFGQVVNIIDPANKAHNLSGLARQKILDVRMNIARRVIRVFSGATAAGTFVPVADLVLDPGLMAGMVYSISRVMGQQMTKERARQITGALLKTCLSTLAIEFGGVTAINIVLQASTLVPAVGILALPALGGMTYFRYRRTAILGEVALEYVKNDFSWGGEDASAVIKRCRDRVRQIYLSFAKEQLAA